MKSTVITIIFTLLFIVFGVYTSSQINNFESKYNSRIDIIESYINNDNWDMAKIELDKYSKDFHNEKDPWYTLLDHTYFDKICLDLDILNKSIKEKDKIVSLKQIVLIKNSLSNISQSEKLDFSYIF